MVATWGAISWRGTAAGGNKIELFTRAGNTETPDDTWSAWSAAVHQRGRLADHQPEGALPAVARGADRQRRRPGADLGDGRVPAAQSPAAGPLASPCIRRASCSRSRSPPANPSSPASTISRRRSASSPPRPAQQPGSSSALGRRTYQKGLQTLVWKADDENDDDLRLRRAVSAAKARRRGRRCASAISDTILVWDTTTVPNGTYFVKIVASDAPSNPSGTALAGELDSVGLRHRQHAADDHGRRRPRRARPHDHPVRRQGRSLAGPARRVLAGRPAVARRVSGGRHRRLARGALRAGRGWRAGRARADAARQRLDEQRGNDPRRRTPRQITEGTEPTGSHRAIEQQRKTCFLHCSAALCDPVDSVRSVVSRPERVERGRRRTRASSAAAAARRAAPAVCWRARSSARAGRSRSAAAFRAADRGAPAAPGPAGRR